MSTITKTNLDWSPKRLLLLMFITGVGLSAISFITLNNFSLVNYDHDSPQQNIVNLCENGLCASGNFDVEAEPIFVQQGTEIKPKTDKISNSELFSDLIFVKDRSNSKEAKIFGNTATLFAEKDSFIREGVKNTNEGASDVLRIMGTGPTNNRAIIAFNQEEIGTIASEKTLQSATIKLFVLDNDNHWNDGQTITIHKLGAGWLEGNGINAPLSKIVGSEKGVTWGCSDDISNCTNWSGGNFSDIPTDSVFISNHIKNGYWIKFDVTQDVKEFLSGEQNHGWIIKKSNENEPGRINFASREAQSNMPELVLVISQ